MTGMEASSMRTQSPKTLSGSQQRSWVMPGLSHWDRKSVSQLVRHYQSCADLRLNEKAEQKLEGRENWKDGSRKGSRGWSSGTTSNLVRSVSMDFLPQRGSVGTRALCALFESKATRQQSVHSDTAGRDTRREPALQAWRKHSSLIKDSIQGTNQVGGGKSKNGLPESYDRVSRHSHGHHYSVPLTESGTPTRQAVDKRSTSASVRDRSALYLARAAATDSTGGSARPEPITTPARTKKTSKMDDADRKVRVSHVSKDEDDLPPPPPPPVPPRPADYEGASSIPDLPVPPPKETFSSFYQQRQKNELKRLFKHIHPDVRANLDEAVDDEILQVVQSDITHTADAAYLGEVQSMRWIFENWTMDSIGDPHMTKKLLDDEELKGGDVRSTSSMFEKYDSSQQLSAQRQTSVRGDVRTSTWLFETQPLDSLNKAVMEKDEVVEAVLKEPIQPGDVRGTRQLFESKPLSEFGRCKSVEDHDFLKLRSELQEQKGNVQKTVKLFHTQPCCAIKDDSGKIHEVKSVCREEINSNNTSTARWLFETQPLDAIKVGTNGVKIIRGISLEEGQKGGFDQKRWMFETQSFGMIQEAADAEKFEGMIATNQMQPQSELNRVQTRKPLEKEEIVGGDVKTSLWLFETQPMDSLKESYEVGSLKKINISAEEQGEVKDKTQKFESCSVQMMSSSKQQEIEKGDVKGFKHLFETIPLSKIAQSNEESTSENENNQEKKSTSEPDSLYAIKDSSGNFHKVTTVSREEITRGKVKNYKWMFETKPIDQMAENLGNVEVIKGITRQEDTTGDVKLAKWLFETETIDGIHLKFNQPEPTSSVEGETRRGDVKTCKWLFETQPMDILYDKAEKEKEKEAIDSDVKSITWLFESQPLDSIKDGEEYNLNLCSTIRDSVKPEVGVQKVKHLFETETLDRINQESNTKQELRCISQVNFQSGDVSRVKELFESQSLDEIGAEEMTTMVEKNQDEEFNKGSVHKFTWMFENLPMAQSSNKDGNESLHQVTCFESGDVQNKKFIFETSSLDQIHDEPFEWMPVSIEKPPKNVDVKSSTMLFESLPLYAIRDKEGQFHEVTTVKKEEIQSGDVKGARWMFETKPLDAIKAENEVYVIRAVTQEDVKKGSVKSARWRFETQPLDSFTSQEEPSVSTPEDFGSSSVQLNKEIFESEQASKKFVRMVSVTDVQHGDVRTSTWLFENQPIDSLKGEPQEQSLIKTVHREDCQKGDVKRSSWLFESQPLDKINEREKTPPQGGEEIPKADVKCTTWLFETTPLDKIMSNSVADTLSYLHQMDFIHSSGIIIEANENRNVNMGKYLVEANNSVQIQNEESVRGNIRNIMLQLLLKPTLKPQVTLLRETEKGNVNKTVMEVPLFSSTSTDTLKSDQRMQTITQMIDELLLQETNMKKGIVMQETAEKQAEMSVYSLIYSCEAKTESQVTERGDVRSTIGNLLATVHNQKTEASCRVDENEKGNVNLLKSCIERGDLHYLKSLHQEDLEDEVDQGLEAREQIETVQGGVKVAKRSLGQQKEHVERTICDVLPGDVKNTKKAFSSDCSASFDSCISKEEIIPGDVFSAKQQLAVQQPILVEKEEIVAGDIKATMQSLERAKQQSMTVERDVITPGTIYDMDLSAQGTEVEGNQMQKEVIISGDVKAAKKSLELAKQQSLNLEREVIVPGKIYNLNVTTQETYSTTETQSACSTSSHCQQVKSNLKVSNGKKLQESHASFEACEDSSSIASNRTESVQPPLRSEYNGYTTEEDTEDIIKGDVKAAIRSLQCAATEQKVLDKENIVRGNVQLALQSLEKSSVNVSKGDYKAAMIYRNSGKACSEMSKTFQQHCHVVSMSPSDTHLSPSIAVTCQGQPTNTLNSTPNLIANGNCQSPSRESGSASSNPQKAERPQEQKPALPPKPQWAKTMDESPSPVNAGRTVKKTLQMESATVPQKQGQMSSFHTNSRLQEATSRSGETLHDTYYQQCARGDSRQLHPMNSRNQEIQMTRGAPSHQGIISNPGEISDSNEAEMEKNVIQKINAAEEIQMCMKSYAEDSRHEMNISLQDALQNFERKDREASNKGIPLSKNVKVLSDPSVREHKPAQKMTSQQKTSPHKSTVPTPAKSSSAQMLNQQNGLDGKGEIVEEKVVLREKKVRETEDERRQRLSVHKEEIMKGNVKAAMEIFENLRKREELKEILSQVEEIEGETNSAEAGTLNELYENVPMWMEPQPRQGRQSRKEERKGEAETHDDDLESISSVETAFEDLEKASKDILNLKEQTLSKLLEIEESIKKALYSVSNLKSEADIVGLSGLFDESLRAEQNPQSGKNIRKISIASSKAKASHSKEMSDVNLQTDLNPSLSNNKEPRHKIREPLVRQSSSQSSPSFISIHSAARKSTEPSKPTMSTFKSNAQGEIAHCETAESSKNDQMKQPKVSFVQVKTVPEVSEGIIGTKTVSETYEETDGFGNLFLSSTTSTVITKQADSGAPALFGGIGNPTRFEGLSSPVRQRSAHSFNDNVFRDDKQEKTVFVTFSHPKEKH